ncbi:MAG TPA: serine hydrolase domain-containing protein [Bryobacteraceae bacterium]|nr:serine hydrolase domain-containing protein [Bryobacteraceae bacterium]
MIAPRIYIRFTIVVMVSAQLILLLLFVAIAAQAQPKKPSPVDGIWLGTLHAGPASLRIQVHVTSDDVGNEHCTLDSLDQGAVGLECENPKLNGNEFSFEVPLVHGSWSGTLSGDGKELHGTWSQSRSLPLDLTRQASAVEVKPPAARTFDAALPPVSASGLEAVLDKDLASAEKEGALGPATGAGMTVGVLKDGERRIFAYGTGKPDSIFEIGSITKTFTGLILAQMIQQGKVKLEEPVRDLLPPGTAAKPEGAEITLLDLVTQHSGLPRMPDNFQPTDAQNPYADYHAANLYAFVAKHGVAKPASAPFLYSNLGFGLLGQALANRARMKYPELLLNEVVEPLHLNETTITLTPEQRRRFIEGHDAKHNPAHAWDLDGLAGAGAIRSTASDMLKYLEANLHPDALHARAFAMSHELRADVSPTMRIGFAWLSNTDSGSYWHNGATGGYSSYALFNPKGNYALVVLFNTSIGGPDGSFADRLGEHISQRLSGKPAISLAP